MDIKALFFDIDGTLVSFNTHLIPQSTIDSLRLAKQQGIKVYISTGRPYPSSSTSDRLPTSSTATSPPPVPCVWWATRW